MTDIHGNAGGTNAVQPLPKLHLIQLLRAIAAMLVVLYHAQLAFSTRFARPAFDGESYLFAFGAVGVHIFFVISGFIMVYTNPPTQKFEARTFFKRRLLRIYPVYWLCCALYLAGHLAIGNPYHLPGPEVAGAFLLVPGHSAAIIGPAWTLAFEMYFYFCFGLAMMLGHTRGLFVLAAAFGLAIAAGFFVHSESPLWKLATDSLLIEFVAGAAVGRLAADNRLPRRGERVLGLIAMLIFMAGLAFGYDKGPSVIVWGVPSAILVLALVIHERNRGTSPIVRKLGHFGDSSYALYLVHILVITLTIELVLTAPILQKTEPALAALPVALVSLLLAEFLHHRIEKPFLRRFSGSRSFRVGRARVAASP